MNLDVIQILTVFMTGFNIPFTVTFIPILLSSSSNCWRLSFTGLVHLFSWCQFQLVWYLLFMSFALRLLPVHSDLCIQQLIKKKRYIKKKISRKKSSLGLFCLFKFLAWTIKFIVLIWGSWGAYGFGGVGTLYFTILLSKSTCFVDSLRLLCNLHYYSKKEIWFGFVFAIT